jgi:hypothetical protein
MDPGEGVPLMDDEALDIVLLESMPSVLPTTPHLESALSKVARRPRRLLPRWRAGLTLTISALLIGGTTAAIASPTVREWLGWTPDRTFAYTSTQGDRCEVSFRIEYSQHRNGLTKTYDEVREIAFVAADQVDLSRAGIARAKRLATLPEGWITDDAGLESYAVTELLYAALTEAFRSNDVHMVGLQIANSCDGEIAS